MAVWMYSRRGGKCIELEEKLIMRFNEQGVGDIKVKRKSDKEYLNMVDYKGYKEGSCSDIQNEMGKQQNAFKSALTKLFNSAQEKIALDLKEKYELQEWLNLFRLKISQHEEKKHLDYSFCFPLFDPLEMSERMSGKITDLEKVAVDGKQILEYQLQIYREIRQLIIYVNMDIDAFAFQISHLLRGLRHKLEVVDIKREKRGNCIYIVPITEEQDSKDINMIENIVYYAAKEQREKDKRPLEKRVKNLLNYCFKPLEKRKVPYYSLIEDEFINEFQKLIIKWVFVSCNMDFIKDFNIVYEDTSKKGTSNKKDENGSPIKSIDTVDWNGRLQTVLDDYAKRGAPRLKFRVKIDDVTDEAITKINENERESGLTGEVKLREDWNTRIDY